MFNQAIDAVQTGKKTIVNTFVKDETVQKELVKLIEAQTKFYQGWVDTTLTLAQTLVSTAKDTVYKGAKYCLLKLQNYQKLSSAKTAMKSVAMCWPWPKMLLWKNTT